MIEESRTLIDFGSDIIFYPSEKLNFIDIISLLRNEEYSVPRSISNDPSETRYELVPNNGRNNLIILTKGRIEFHYTSSIGKEQNTETLNRVEQNIEVLLNLDGE